MIRPIRLTCQYCDTDECDEVTEIPADWSDVEEVPSIGASGGPKATDEQSRSPPEWFTHIGVCPACQIEIQTEGHTSSRRNSRTRTRAFTDSEDSIADVLERLREELSVVRQRLDEIHDELEWATQNYGEGDHITATPRRITSLPLDPCAPHWAEQVNRVSAADLPAEIRDPTPKQQGQLF